jgi:hypothetical protein
VTFLLRLHLDPLIGLRGRPRHWIQTARELSGSPVPKKSQPTPNSPILQLLPPLPEGLGYGLDLRAGPIPGRGVTCRLLARAHTYTTPFCAGQTDQALRAGGPLHCTSVRLLPPGCAHRKCACAGYSRAAITRSPTARSLCVVSPPSRRPQESRLLPTAEPSFFNLFGFSSYLGTSRASIWSAAAAYSPSQPRYLALSSLIPNQV